MSKIFLLIVLKIPPLCPPLWVVLLPSPTVPPWVCLLVLVCPWVVRWVRWFFCSFSWSWSSLGLFTPSLLCGSSVPLGLGVSSWLSWVVSFSLSFPLGGVSVPSVGLFLPFVVVWFSWFSWWWCSCFLLVSFSCLCWCWCWYYYIFIYMLYWCSWSL